MVKAEVNLSLNSELGVVYMDLKYHYSIFMALIPLRKNYARELSRKRGVRDT